MARRWRVGSTQFILICTGLLVVDFIIGVVSFARCTDAGDACGTTNESIDSVTFAVAGALVGLIACGLVVDTIGRYRRRQSSH